MPQWELPIGLFQWLWRGPSCSIEVTRCSCASSDESCAVTTLVSSRDAAARKIPLGPWLLQRW